MKPTGLYEFTICALLLTCFLVSSPADLSAEDDNLSESRFYYSGTVGDGLAIQMELVIDSTDVTGSYMYDKVGIPLSLTGDIDTDTSIITLTEQDDKGQKTGTFKGKLVSEGTNFGKSIEGTWTKADGANKIPFKLGKIAYYVYSELKAGGKYEMSYLVPDFLSEAKPARDITETLEKKALEEQAKFTKEAEDFFGTSDSAGEWQENYSYSIEYYSPDLISLSGEVFSYTGGAHGNTFYMSSNYWIKDGKAHLIGLSDLFRPNSGYMKVLSDYCMGDLRKQNAGWVVNGELKELKAEDLGAFAISPRGISFAFAPYAVGSYAEGSYFVVIPYSELKDVISPSGPLAKFAPAPASEPKKN